MEVSFMDTEKEKLKMDLSYNAMLKITKEIGSDAYVLYAYYHSKYQRWKWRDKNIAKDLGWSESKLKRIKKSLKTEGWIYWFKINTHIFTYIGPYNAYVGKLEELKEHGYTEDESVGILNEKLDTGEIKVLTDVPHYQRSLYNTDYVDLEEID